MFVVANVPQTGSHPNVHQYQCVNDSIVPPKHPCRKNCRIRAICEPDLQLSTNGDAREKYNESL
jgi:hypothetical protein